MKLNFTIFVYIITIYCFTESISVQGTQLYNNGLQLCQATKAYVYEKFLKARECFYKGLNSIKKGLPNSSTVEDIKESTQEELKERAEKLRELLKNLQNLKFMEDSSNTQESKTKPDVKEEQNEENDERKEL